MKTYTFIISELNLNLTLTVADHRKQLGSNESCTTSSAKWGYRVWVKEMSIKVKISFQIAKPVKFDKNRIIFPERINNVIIKLEHTTASPIEFMLFLRTTSIT